MTRLVQVFALLLWVAAPGSAQEAVARFGNGATPFLIRSTTDIEIIRPVIERFAGQRADLTINYEQWGSNALFARSRSDCRGQGTPADAILSSAVQQMVWLVNAACAASYRSAATLALPQTRRWRDELWGITTEPAVIAYNKAAFAGREVPRSRFALLDVLRADPERFRAKIATYDIAASGLGYLFAFSDSLEATTFGALLESFARIEAVATCCSAEIIAGVAEGRYLVAYNVLGSYVASAGRPEVGMVLPEDYTLVLSRAFMIPQNAVQEATATAFLDFLITAEAQELLRQIGLVASMEFGETSLTPSARRTIALSPSLLVALDGNRRAQLYDAWQDALGFDTGR
ncbi:ABC transporter substrate-binding protein [Palleronia caenipelagi]|uniref:ABC transporter substrate-binding protein n=1 Tax=Palleronia caenipelagi TaxID=2489174 RepID=A0A547PP01_9RHOB|nr:ABC transporter substrate-binding protein [Palleronia caenipelagi]TRD15877.1 ABC transporter substrate-binding protein [Palleronia caenipelagi]